MCMDMDMNMILEERNRSLQAYFYRVNNFFSFSVSSSNSRPVTGKFLVAPFISLIESESFFLRLHRGAREDNVKTLIPFS
jgi:hypothetical protein